MNEYRNDLISLYNKTRTIPGTGSFHQFVPISSNSIGAKCVSEESEYSLVCISTTITIKNIPVCCLLA